MGYESDMIEVKRRQKIAEMLMSQGAEPLQTNQMAGGYVVPVSPLQGLAKVAQQLSGAYIGRKASEQDAEIRQARQDALASIDFNAPDAASQLSKAGMVHEALQLRMQQAMANHGGTPGQWYIPAGATAFKDPETGIVGYKTKEGAIIPSRAAMTDYQASMTNPAAIADREAARVGQGSESTTDSEGHPIIAPKYTLNPDFVDARKQIMSTQIDSTVGGKKPFAETIAPLVSGRSNNVGNIRPVGSTEGFQKFDSPEQGIEAVDNQLAIYGSKYGINTLSGAISRWSPPNENQTSALIANASKRLGIPPNHPIDLSDPVQRHAVATAIMLQENDIFKPRSGKAQSPAEKAAAVANAELPIKLAEEQAKANIGVDKELTVTKAKNDLEIENARNEKLAGIKYNAEQSSPLIDEAINLLPNTVSGGLNAKWNDALEAMNVSTDRAKAKARLDAIGADLTSKVPKAPGAQSDIELKYAQQQAGNLANSNVPWETRLSAAKYLKDRNEKILKGEDVPAPPSNPKASTGGWSVKVIE
jgi:hypothetical protein